MRVRGYIKTEMGHAKRSLCDRYESRAEAKHDSAERRRHADRAACEDGIDDFYTEHEEQTFGANWQGANFDRDY